MISWFRNITVRHWKALFLDLCLQNGRVSLKSSLILYSIHILGFFAIIWLTNQPFWFIIPAILLIQPIVTFIKIKRWYFLPETLAPFSVAYIVLFLGLLGQCVASAQGSIFKTPVALEVWSRLLNLDLAVTLSLLWTMLAQARLYQEAQGILEGKYRWATPLGFLLFGLALVWSAATGFIHHTHGVTASDPYAYVQMGVDLAKYGSPLHRFDFVPQVAKWGLPLWPLVPVGYRPPDPQTGQASTVWPPGYSFFVSIAYLLGDEKGIYFLTPLLNIASLVTLWFLCLRALHSISWQDDQRFLAAGVATLVLATSHQQVEHALIPMADIGSQLFTTLTVLFVLCGIQAPYRVLFPFLSGLCLGIAFAIRYTQVLMSTSILAAAFLYLRYYRKSWKIVMPAASLAFGAWAPALVVFWYHQIAFGSPFKVGSSELALFSWEYLPITFVRVLRDLFRTNEFLYVTPFLAWGVSRFWHKSRQTAIILGVGYAATILFHLFYKELRLRDLLAILPPVALLVGFGVADLLFQVQKLKYPRWQKLCLALAVIVVTSTLWLRMRITWQLPFSAKGFNTFGYLSADQREAFDVLGRLTSPTCIVAASLNSGAIELYAGRDAVRPAYWSEHEWLTFVDNALSDGRKVFLLVDGEEMKHPKEVVKSRYHLAIVSQLPLPYFYPEGRATNAAIMLYEVIPQSSSNFQEAER